MKNSAKQYAVALYQAINDTPAKDWSELLKNFTELLAHKHLLSQAPKIVAAFKKYFQQRENIAEITLTTAKPLGSAELKKITTDLIATTKQQVELINLTDEQIIGGVKLQYQDLVIDGTLAGRLADLKTKLIKY